jgi:predicted MFS family arabinose efflux permease
MDGYRLLGLYTYLAEVMAACGAGALVHVFIWLWGLGGMAGALLVGRVIDRALPPPRATLLLLLLLGLGFALLGWGTPPVMGVACFLWGLAGWASIVPQQHALVSRVGAQATAAIAWNSSVNYLGRAIGAALGSAALTHHGAAWLPWGAMASVVAVVMHLVKPR